MFKLQDKEQSLKSVAAQQLLVEFIHITSSLADTPSPQSSLVVTAVADSRSAQILVVGGGGEGGKDDGGGGGAGSVVYDPTFSLSGNNTYAVTVGDHSINSLATD